MDYYLEDRTRLQGQPKRTIADYVEQNGILIPRRFDSLQEAKNSGVDILARSEHPQEYDGASGLLHSFTLIKGMSNKRNGKIITLNPTEARDLKELAEKYFEFNETCNKGCSYRRYCGFLGLDVDEFKTKTSFSLWENLPGVNRTIIADSSIPNRYHIMSFTNLPENNIFNYSIIENGEISREFVMPLPQELRDGLASLIELYEKVRNLSRFDSNHCPIVEAQTVDGKNYFLQYHRCRDFKPVEFNLKRKLEDREIEVSFVRGATEEQGTTYKTTIFYKGGGGGESISIEEDGSFDFHRNRTFQEIMVRKRKFQWINIARSGFEWNLMKLIIGHDGKSTLFKPEVSVIEKEGVLISENEFERFYERLKQENIYINLHVVSDGRRAFIKRVD